MKGLSPEEGRTGVAPGRRGVHAECLGHVHATAFAFELHYWPVLPAFFFFPPLIHSFIPSSLHIFTLQNLMPFLSYFYFWYLVDTQFYVTGLSAFCCIFPYF